MTELAVVCWHVAVRIRLAWGQVDRRLRQAELVGRRGVRSAFQEIVVVVVMNVHVVPSVNVGQQLDVHKQVVRVFSVNVAHTDQTSMVVHVGVIVVVLERAVVHVIVVRVEQRDRARAALALARVCAQMMGITSDEDNYVSFLDRVAANDDVVHGVVQDGFLLRLLAVVDAEQNDWWRRRRRRRRWRAWGWR